MMTPEQLKSTHIAIATPCYGGNISMTHYLSVVRLLIEASAAGVPFSLMVRGGDSLIPRIRNSMVAEFMASEVYTHLLWIDADIGFEPSAVWRLLMSDHDVCGGIYPLKKIVIPETISPQSREEFLAANTHYPVNYQIGSSHVDEQGFMEVLDLPTGMMMVKREVFEKMAEAYPHLTYTPDSMLGLEHCADHTFHYRFFDVMTEENGRYLSEDYAFSRRWQAIGGRTMADTQSKLSHYGSHLYEGDFSASLLHRLGAINALIEAAKVPDEAPAKPRHRVKATKA